jgi:hypothetical protein
MFKHAVSACFPEGSETGDHGHEARSSLGPPRAFNESDDGSTAYQLFWSHRMKAEDLTDNDFSSPDEDEAVAAAIIIVQSAAAYADRGPSFVNRNPTEWRHSRCYPPGAGRQFSASTALPNLCAVCVQIAPNIPLYPRISLSFLLKTQLHRYWPFASGAKGRWFESTRAYQLSFSESSI